MRTKKRVEIKNFNNFDNNSNDVCAEKFYNYLPTNKLNNSIGVKSASFPYSATDPEEYELNLQSKNVQSVEGIAYFKQYFAHNGVTTHRLLVYDGSKVYINQMLDDSSDIFWLYDLTFNTAPITLAYKKDDSDAIILASKDEMKIWKTGYSPYTISDVPIITSMCMNEGVLFCTIVDPAFKIWYATNLDAENVGNISKNSGYISLEDDLGYARKIITFNESVYVFRDYGITKIDSYQGNFSINQVYLSNTKIYADTINVCGNMVLYLTKEGIHTFNGVKVGKLNIDLSNIDVECDNAVASSIQNKYYLALRVNFNDENAILCENEEFVNNVLLAIDVNNNSYEIVRGIDIKNLLPIKTEEFEKMLVIFNSVYKDKVGEIVNIPICMEDNLPKYWHSGELVDSCNNKLFTKLFVEADEGVKFKLIYDDKELTLTTYKKGLNQFMFKISCNQIKLEISSSNKFAQVDNVYLDYYEY